MEGISPDYWVENQTECLEKLKEHWDKIPLLGSVPFHTLREGQLIRFRGMIQDMLSPLLYFTKVEVLNKVTQQKEMVYGKYKELAFFDNYEELNIDNDIMVDQERLPYYCISTPGLNEWARPNIEEPLPCNEVIYERVGSEDVTDRSAHTEDGSQTKREANTEETDVPSNVSKRQRSSEVENSPESDNVSKTYHPILSKDNHACLVTLYDIKDGAVKLNEIIEVVGFLWHSGKNDGDVEEDTELPPLIPRLHAVQFKKVTNSNPLWIPSLDHRNIMEEGEKLRGELHLALTQLMMGDTLAADYLICNLISSIYTRQDFLSLGNLCVNFSKAVADGFPEGVYKIVSKLVPKSHYLPFSLNAMNTLTLLPEKDYEKNRLKSGLLQLSDHTHLILDETKMQVGKLEERGVRNVNTLNDLISFQKLFYNFRYHEMAFDTDIPVIILSEGKSMLKNNVEVVLEATIGGSILESVDAVETFLKEPLLSSLRIFLSVASNTNFTIPPKLMSEVIEKEFVEMRQDSILKTSVADLHNLLVIARLVSLSYGKNIMCPEMWHKAVAMERERKLRLLKRTRT